MGLGSVGSGFMLSGRGFDLEGLRHRSLGRGFRVTVLGRIGVCAWVPGTGAGILSSMGEFMTNGSGGFVIHPKP